MLRKLKNLIRPTVPRDWENVGIILAAKSIMNTATWREIPDYSDPFWIQEKEFQVYSQFGDDGIIQWLLHKLYLEKISGRFIEFGVGDYFESNTHFLLVNNRWEGYVMDSSKSNIKALKASPIYWRYKINARRKFITKENIQRLVNDSCFDKVELLHIDIDGNDYWVLEALDLGCIDPDILILEYNANFGSEHAVTIPYDPDFYRMNAHYSGLYWGASLSALNSLAISKGYYFVGCNSAGNNAYFLANRHITSIPKTDLSSGFQSTGYREAKNEQGELIFSEPAAGFKTIKGLPVVDLVSGNKIELGST